MASKFKEIFKNFRVIIYILFLVFALIAIRPNPLKDGVAIRAVIPNSSANVVGIESPRPNSPLTSREVIQSINNKPIENIADYESAIRSLRVNSSIQIKTDRKSYRVVTREKFETIPLNGTEIKEVEEVREVNETVNGTIVTLNKSFIVKKEVPKTMEVSRGLDDLGLRVYNAPKSNIRLGLDLAGGTRVVLQPENKLSQNDIDNLISVMKERLNVYGLSDLTIAQASDLSKNQYIIVEIAGATSEEVKDLLAKQGKFEAKIANETVFKGGTDITYVCRSPDCAGLDPSRGCNSDGAAWFCGFRFSIVLLPEAAQRQADVTKDLEVVTESKQQYLSESLKLFLDDKLVDELRIGAELKGSAETSIQISGSGLGNSQQEAAVNALQSMKRLQTILITGSLPVKLNLVKIDTISPLLGHEFLKNAFLIGFLSIVVVAVIIFARYRKLQVSIPLMITSFSELIILLGVAALIGWNIDLAAIAGIIIAIGTGVDHQILITDETIGGGIKRIFNWKERIKGAFYIIMGAYFTTVVAMVPLLFAGAGLLKGFAIISIIGVSIGVFITRPVYAKVIEILLRDA